MTFKGSRTDRIVVLLGTVFEDGAKPMILQNRTIEKIQKPCVPNLREMDISQFNRLIVLDKKLMFSPLCSMGIVPFCISSSHITLTQKTFRTNYCLYYDSELCIAAISEGFGSSANEISYICCRHAVKYLLSQNIESGKLSQMIEDCFADVERHIDLLEKTKGEEIDTIVSGASLAILIIYKNKIASGVIGDAVLIRLSQEVQKEKMKMNKIEIIQGLSMSDENYREKIYSSIGEIRKNGLGKECIYIKGRDYPESPMMSCLGCAIGKRIGVSADGFSRQDDRNSIIDKQCCLLLCNREFLKILEDKENTNLLSCLNLSDANAIREYIYGKLKIQYLQKGNPVDDCLCLMFVIDKDSSSNKDKM